MHVEGEGGRGAANGAEGDQKVKGPGRSTPPTRDDKRKGRGVRRERERVREKERERERERVEE